METNPGKILQNHGIEVGIDDPRTSEQILAHFVAAGHISLSAEIEVVTPESTV